VQLVAGRCPRLVRLFDDGGAVAKLRVQVRLNHGTNASPVLTGLIMLARSGVVELEIQRVPRLRCPSPSFVEARVAGRVVVAYDLEDGYIIDWPTRDRYLETVQFCFKRCYNVAYHAGSKFAERIVPLGLVYDVAGALRSLGKKSQ
jgi:hypothetical protein